ncbi:MAG: hypothetical protein NVS3B12_01020 [Acidimicrobiales bacterium]
MAGARAGSCANDPYAEAVAQGLRDALLCGMTVDPSSGDWRHDWHPRSRRAAFVGVVEEFGDGTAELVVLFRAGPSWEVLYGWRAVLWGDRTQRTVVRDAHPHPHSLVGSLALDVMEGLDGGRWVLPSDAAAEGPWGPGSHASIAWVRERR